MNYIQDLITAHPGIVLGPVRPWRDRFGVWHGDHFDEDPAEAIRSVRRAFVGPWVIRAVPVEGGYAARWSLVLDSREVIAAGPVRGTLDSAIDDAAEFVEQARLRVDAGE